MSQPSGSAGTPLGLTVERLAGGLLKLGSLYLGAVAVFLILLAAVGVDIAVPMLREIVSLYEGLWSFIVFQWLEGAVVWLAEQIVGWLGPWVAIQPHWRDVFTILTLYFLADTAQFTGNRYWPNALTSLVAGVILALAAAVLCGVLPILDPAIGPGLAALAAAVGSVVLYWMVMAWAHATWRRRDRPPVQDFKEALTSRVALALRRGGLGLVAGVAIYCAAILAGVPGPALLALACLTALLGGLWIARGLEQARQAKVQSWRQALTYSSNVTMGAEMAGKFLIGLILFGINALGLSL